jgi:excisionase family DNA binding protein
VSKTESVSEANIEPQQVRISEAATILRVSRRTIYTLLHTGKLASTGSGRLRRITMKSIRDYITRGSN